MFRNNHIFCPVPCSIQSSPKSQLCDTSCAGCSCCGWWEPKRRKLWDFLDKPQSSRAALVSIMFRIVVKAFNNTEHGVYKSEKRHLELDTAV